MSRYSAKPSFTLSALTLALFAGLSGSAYGNSVPSNDKLAAFQAYKQQALQQQSFQAYKTQKLADYEQFRQNYLAAFDAYRGKLLQHWDIAPLSDEHTLVQYDEQQQTRTEIDYEQDTITVSVLHEPNSPPSPQQIKAALIQVQSAQVEDALAADPTLQSSADNRAPLVPQLADSSPTELNALLAQADVETRPREYNKARLAQMQAEIEQQGLAAQQELEREADLNPEVEVSPEQLAQIQAQTAQRQNELAKQYQQAQADDPTSKAISSYRINLPSKSLQSKAQPYLARAQEQADEFDVDLPLMLAIMQAESSFNPTARSHVPAFGLMQIVPTTAGLDVRQKMEQSNVAPTPDELYQTDFNIRYGGAYLNILEKRYLNKITDPLSRMYCVIAAYNTGAGNVAKAFNGRHSGNVGQAAKKINAMTPEQVYQRLLSHLPYVETQKYLPKVVKYREQYAQLQNMQPL